MSFIFEPVYMESSYRREYFFGGELPRELDAASSTHIITLIGCDLIPSGVISRICEECANRQIEFSYYFDPRLPDAPLAVLTSSGRAVICDNQLLFDKKRDPRTRVYDFSALFENDVIRRQSARLQAYLKVGRESAQRMRGFALLIEKLYEECCNELMELMDGEHIAGFLRQTMSDKDLSSRPDINTRLECTVQNSKLFVYMAPDIEHTLYYVSGAGIGPMVFLLLIESAAKNRYKMKVSRHPFVNMPLAVSFPEQKITFTCLGYKRGILCPVTDFMLCGSETVKRRCDGYAKATKAIYELYKEAGEKYCDSMEQVCCICSGAINENALDAFVKRLLIDVFCG